MKLSALTKMAVFALDSFESGDSQAAEELRTFVLDNVTEVAECLGLDVEKVRGPLSTCSLEDVPRLLRNTCKAGGVRKVQRDREDDKRDKAVCEACARLVDCIALAGEDYEFDGRALAAVAKSAKASDRIAFSVSAPIGITKAGTGMSLMVPVRILKGLDRVRPLKDCTVKMTSPVRGEWTLTVRWATGQWRALRTEFQPRDAIPVFVPSMTDMVSRELGCAEVAA
jgi:hypothetical protein